MPDQVRHDGQKLCDFLNYDTASSLEMAQGQWKTFPPLVIIAIKIVLITKCNIEYKERGFFDKISRFPKAGKLQRAVAHLTPETTGL
jgi:hypothetical protein